jgi:TorA maturation chaperone TorD
MIIEEGLVGSTFYQHQPRPETSMPRKALKTGGVNSKTDPENERIKGHIALEFEFMANLCNKTLDAVQAQNKTAARASLEWQKKFFDEHLSVWIPRFCNDLTRLAHSDFYRGIALLTAELLETERETIPALLAELAD